MPTGKVRLAGTEHSPLFFLLRGGCRELLHTRRTLPSPGHLAWARAWVRPGLGPGNQHQEETRSRSSAGFTSRAPNPSGQGLPASGRARRVQPRPRLRRSGETVSRSAGSGDKRGERALAVAVCGDPSPHPPACAACPRLCEKRALKRASPRPEARDRELRARIGAPWKVTAAGARQDGTMGAGSPGGRPPASASETRRLPRALGFGAERPLLTLWAAWSGERTGARSLLPASGRAGTSVRGPAWEQAGGRGVRALG